MDNRKDQSGNFLPDDVRLNKYGKFIRKTSLDELPELFNIFIGNMSIIGPRPLSVEYLPWYNESERKRHVVRPGLSGWAQVNGRTAIGWDKRFEYDLYYVDKIGLFFDVKIVLLTLLKVLKREDYVEAGHQGNFDDWRKEELRKGKKMKKLLMLGSSKGSIEMIQYANKIGIYTIVTDPNLPERSPAKRYSDEFWMIDACDIDMLEKKCIEEGVNAVCCGISTSCIPSAIKLCNRLGLPFYCNEHAWHYTINKFDFKRLCRTCGVPLAKDFFVSENPTNEELNNIEFPVVVKAVDQSANRGMTFCYKPEDIVSAIKYAHSFSKNKNIVIEKMLHGCEYTAYYCLVDGDAKLVCLFSDLSDDRYPNSCYLINTTICSKTKLFMKEVDPYFRDFLKKANATNGVCWIELILDKDEHFYVIEMGYRMSGDMMAIPIDYKYGFNSYKWLVDYSLGEKQTLPYISDEHDNRFNSCSYIIWSGNSSGVITKIEGLEMLGHISNLKITNDIYVGSKYHEYQYLLTLTFTNKTIEELIDNLKTINEAVKIYDECGKDISIKFSNFDKLYRC